MSSPTKNTSSAPKEETTHELVAVTRPCGVAAGTLDFSDRLGAQLSRG